MYLAHMSQKGVIINTAISVIDFETLLKTASSVAERKRITRDSGVTGECIFYRFTDLCGFDPIRDLTIDAMHAVVLDLVKTELENHLLADLGPNASVAIAERDSSQGGLLVQNDLVNSLNKVN